MTNIPHSKPFLSRKEISAVSKTIASGQLAQGPQVEQLEDKIVTYVNHRYGIAVSSGTAALFMALKSLHIGKGDAVVIPSYVCTALINAVTLTQASPILCDVNPENGNMEEVYIKKVLKKNVGAIIVPHLFGNPVDIAAIETIGVPVIEDCAQCFGTTVRKRNVGGLSTIAVFSFYATKVLAAGEGGMIATSDRIIAENLRDMRDYDNCQDYKFRFNFKMSELNAALALQQFYKLDSIIKRRQNIASQYTSALRDTNSSILLPPINSESPSMHYRYVVRIPNSKGIDIFIKKMKQKGISCARPIFKPLHHYLKQKKLPNSQKIYEQAVSIPCYPALRKPMVTYIAAALKEILN